MSMSASKRWKDHNPCAEGTIHWILQWQLIQFLVSTFKPKPWTIQGGIYIYINKNIYIYIIYVGTSHTKLCEEWDVGRSMQEGAMKLFDNFVLSGVILIHHEDWRCCKIQSLKPIWFFFSEWEEKGWIINLSLFLLQKKKKSWLKDAFFFFPTLFKFKLKFWTWSLLEW